MDEVRGSLWLLRHGDTEWASTGRHTGRTDIPLSPTGEQAARDRRSLIGTHDFGLVLSSPLQRARRTAELAGARDIALDDDLLEWDYGAWEGKRTADIRTELGEPHWTIWDEPIPPGDTPGEQAEEVAARAGRVIARCDPVLASGRDCLLVAHSHLLRILTATWLALPAVDGRLWALAPAGVAILGHEREQRIIARWNI